MIVLLSGGMDSATLLARVISLGAKPTAVSFRYGSKHQDAELESAARVAEAYGVHRLVVDVPAIVFQGSALTDGELPMDRELDQMTGVAPSYVPARNTVLLALAAALADGRGVPTIAYAAHIEDHVGYPDCRPEYARAMADAVRLGTRTEVHLLAPFMGCTKAQIVKTAADLGVPLALTTSCYQGRFPACGRCDTCKIRLDAFRRAGYVDPLPYAVEPGWSPGALDWPQDVVLQQAPTV